MKVLFILLCLAPSTLLAQQTHRDATAEEKKILLSSEDEENLKKLGIETAKEVERNILKEALLRQALVNGKLDNNQTEGFIQKLTDQGLKPKEIDDEIENLSAKYFAELQLKALNKIIPLEKQKEYENKFDSLQKKAELENLTHSELDQEISRLDEIISSSSITKQNEIKLEELKKSFISAQTNSTFVKQPYLLDQKQFTPVKVMVPYNFKISEKQNGPLCLTNSQVSHSSQFELLNHQMKDITQAKDRPLIHQVYFAWGYNRGYHSDTDVKFTTSDGTFTIHSAHGDDRPSPFDPKIYFNPNTMSIPQYNIEFGVMFNEKWGMELKHDHMKLVFDNTRPYEISGDYNRQVIIKNDNPTSFWDEEIPVDFSVAKAKKDATWLKFEHSDGYNYTSLAAVYNQNLYTTKNNKFKIDSRFSAGAGLMIPKTKVVFHQDQRWNHHGLDNKFHIAGGGIHADTKLRFTFWNAIFLQAATRGTYIKVKDALVDGTESRMEHIQPIASVQFMGQVGYVHTFKEKKKKQSK